VVFIIFLVVVAAAHNMVILLLAIPLVLVDWAEAVLAVQVMSMLPQELTVLLEL
jgi:hypothetical protein